MLTSEEYLDRIREEQRAFDALLPRLLETHPGAFVVLRGGEVQGTFPDYASAYAFAVGRFGLDEPFLVAPVASPRVESISVAWDAGVMFA